MRNNNFYRGEDSAQSGATGWENMEAAPERPMTPRERAEARTQRWETYHKIRRQRAFMNFAKKAAAVAAGVLVTAAFVGTVVASSNEVVSSEKSDNVFENVPGIVQVEDASSLTFRDGAFVRTETKVSGANEMPNYLAEMPREETTVDVSEYNVYEKSDPKDANGPWVGVGARKDGDPNGQTFAEKLAEAGYTSVAKAESAAQNDKDGVVWSSEKNVTVNKKQ